MRMEVEKVKKGKSRVNIFSNSDVKVGFVDVSKSHGVAVKYLENSRGQKHDEYSMLMRKAKEIDSREGGINSSEIKKNKPRRRTITNFIKEAMDQGHITPKAVLAYLDAIPFAYNTNSVYSILWQERKERGLGALRPKVNFSKK